MIVKIDKKAPQQMSETPVLQQTTFWSEVKRKQGIGSKAFDIKTRAADLFVKKNQCKYIIDDILILFQSIGDDYQIAYIPYGPTLEPSEENQGKFLEELSESLRPFLPNNCILLRYDLLWESLWAKDEGYFSDDGGWTGPPSKKSQEIRLNINTQNWNLKKANTDILPPDTVFMDLRKDTNLLLAKMKPKTRYNVRLSARKGVKVIKTGFKNLDIWYDLYEQTCARNGIFHHDIKYFKAVLETKVEDSDSPVDVELLIAEIQGEPRAAMFLVISGKRATYLYGASSSINRNYMATYALQWEAIQRAKSKGCAEYDMFGVAPKPDPSHPMYGLYRFKTGFGGSLFHRMGCWDYPLDIKKYETYNAFELHSQGYHIN